MGRKLRNRAGRGSSGTAVPRRTTARATTHGRASGAQVAVHSGTVHSTAVLYASRLARFLPRGHGRAARCTAVSSAIFPCFAFLDAWSFPNI